jgi:cytochrome c oxidase subunit III
VSGAGLQNEDALQRRIDAQARVRQHGAALDVRALPSFGFGHRSLMWWGTLGLITIESTIFAMAIGTYFFLMTRSTLWPPTEAAADWRWGALNTLLFLISLWPALQAKRKAEQLDLRGMRLWISASSAATLLILAVRVFEFRALNCTWDSSAYGSVVWMIMGLHTVHLVTDAYDTWVLNALAFTGPLEGKRFVDVSENSLYWVFVVVSWLPIVAVVYGVPRWL